MAEDSREELFYRLVLTFVPGIGVKYGKSLLQHYGSAIATFKAPLKDIKNIDGIGELRAKGFKDPDIYKLAEKELEYINKHNINVLLYGAPGYPTRLTNCSDAPLLLYYNGNTVLDAKKVIAIVGTRKYTEYGLKLTEELVEGLQMPDILIVSGLALGIDAIAHKKAVKLSIPTVGVLGHGLDRIYPSTNKTLSNEMLQNGGLLTEFPAGTTPERTNFPMRNRVVAGMSDVTVVVESDIAGGALITAMMANGYNREVAAYPGRTTDAKSSGCNELIKKQHAQMISSPTDLLELMNWSDGARKKPMQRQLFIDLEPSQQKVFDLLQGKESVHADEIYHTTGLANSELAVALLELEMQGIIKTLPGKQYRLT
ncbi:MAG: DNA-processing protein DprA [Flavipsychrobacter sp.]|nr:DNA-processing protein DprA [Flavipsychrobacter sp.]